MMPTAASLVKNKRRYCRLPGCEKIVKSQGLCQRHGAKTRKCKAESCDKQAQGNFDGMCKKHFKLLKEQLIARPPKATDLPRPDGVSVFQKVIPDSLGWGGVGKLPLIQYLQTGFDEQRPRGWHRNEERRARGLSEVFNPAIQLECWERELVWMEICLLSGSPHASFRHLARAWGRDKGFHMVLAQFICDRQGNVERKQRVKGENVESVVTRKKIKKTVTLNPGEDDDLDVEWDQVDFEIFNAMEGSADRLMRWDDDPTVNFESTSIKTRKKRTLTMSALMCDYCDETSESDNEDCCSDDAVTDNVSNNEAVAAVPVDTSRHCSFTEAQSDGGQQLDYMSDSLQNHIPPYMVNTHSSPELQTMSIQHDRGMMPPNSLTPPKISKSSPPGAQFTQVESLMERECAHPYSIQDAPHSLMHKVHYMHHIHPLSHHVPVSSTDGMVDVQLMEMPAFVPPNSTTS